MVLEFPKPSPLLPSPPQTHPGYVCTYQRSVGSLEVDNGGILFPRAGHITREREGVIKRGHWYVVQDRARENDVDWILLDAWVVTPWEVVVTRRHSVVAEHQCLQ